MKKCACLTVVAFIIAGGLLLWGINTFGGPWGFHSDTQPGSAYWGIRLAQYPAAPLWSHNAEQIVSTMAFVCMQLMWLHFLSIRFVLLTYIHSNMRQVYRLMELSL